ncbi:MAG: XdhC family aldehyde oxidoreductase maturation factor [Selenomonadaceae bacterium]
MKKFYQNVFRLISSGENLALATILYSSGSAPRSAGAKMIVRSDGSIIGTVGGGRLEAETIQLSQKVHISHQAIMQDFDLTGNDAAGLGMICGGSGKIFIDYITADDPDMKAVYESVLSTFEHEQKSWLITEFMLVQGEAKERQQYLVLQDKTIVGGCQSSAEFINTVFGGLTKNSIHTEVRAGRHYIAEPIRNAGTVYLFGAGHVSQQVARLTNMVGFRTVIIDDRPEFANQKRFPEAEVLLIGDFKCLPEMFIDSDSYLVIVTRGHLNDGAVLEQTLLSGAVYIGMIGSKRKRDTLYKDMQQKGFCEEDLRRVHAPIGIEIYAETPEEIAVSIVAELIKARAEREKCLTQKK